MNSSVVGRRDKRQAELMADHLRDVCKDGWKFVRISREICLPAGRFCDLPKKHVRFGEMLRSEGHLWRRRFLFGCRGRISQIASKRDGQNAHVAGPQAVE